MALVFSPRRNDLDPMDRALSAVRWGRVKIGEKVKVYDELFRDYRLYRAETFAGYPALTDLGLTRVNLKKKGS